MLSSVWNHCGFEMNRIDVVENVSAAVALARAIAALPPLTFENLRIVLAF